MRHSMKKHSTCSLLAALASRGYKTRLVPITSLPGLRQHFAARLKTADPLIRRYLSFLKYQPPKTFLNARSVLVLAIDQPILRVAFSHKGRTVHSPVPPSYYDYYMHERGVRGILKQAGYTMARSKLPQKTLAVCSGLAKFGRNNIAYVPGWGSFVKLFVFWTDIPARGSLVSKPALLDQCRTCRACIKACPSGAIGSARFLIHAGKCITWHNERPPETPFPRWIKPGWHNCIVGCLRCQAVCPANKGVLKNIVDRGRFTEKDTAYLLKGSFTGNKAKAMDARLKRVGLDLSIFPRNLRALLDRPLPQV
jgi:epoxyqueuosine reductase